MAASSKMETVPMAGKPKNPATSPTGVPQIDKQRKIDGREGNRCDKLLQAPHTTVLLPAEPIHKLYRPKHMESACASIPNPLIILGSI